MPRLTAEEKRYVIARTSTKRRVFMTKPLHYQVAENLFLISSVDESGPWKLVDNLNAPTCSIDDPDKIKRILNTAFKIELDRNQALQNLLKLEEIQYIFLKAEEALLSRLEDQLSQREKEAVKKIKEFSDKICERKANLNHERSNSSVPKMDMPDEVRKKTSNISPPPQVSCPSEEDTVSLDLTAFNKHTHTFHHTKGFNFVSVVSKIGNKIYSESIYAKDLFPLFKKNYENRSIFSKFASFFTRDALDRASDPRPWYQRLFSSAPAKNKTEKMVYLLMHAKNNPKSNTAMALRNVFDAKVAVREREEHEAELQAAKAELQAAKVEAETRAAEEARAAEEVKAKADAEVIRKAEAVSFLAWRGDRFIEFNSPFKRLAYEEERVRDSIVAESRLEKFKINAKKPAKRAAAVSVAIKNDSLAPSSGDSSISNSALSAAEYSEPVSPISFQGRQQRSGSPDSGVLALMSSVRFGSFPPSPNGSSRRATPVDVMESQCNIRQEMLMNLEEEFVPLWKSLPQVVLTQQIDQKTGEYTLIFSPDIKTEISEYMVSGYLGYFVYQTTIDQKVAECEMAKKLYAGFDAFRTLVKTGGVTIQYVDFLLQELVRDVTLLFKSENNGLVAGSEFYNQVNSLILGMMSVHAEFKEKLNSLPVSPVSENMMQL